jgi:hypothetical protein
LGSGSDDSASLLRFGARSVPLEALVSGDMVEGVVDALLRPVLFADGPFGAFVRHGEKREKVCLVWRPMASLVRQARHGGATWPIVLRIYSGLSGFAHGCIGSREIVVVRDAETDLCMLGFCRNNFQPRSTSTSKSTAG